MPRLLGRSKTLELIDSDISEKHLQFLSRQISLAIDTETGGLDARANDLRLITISTIDNHVILIRYPNRNSLNLYKLFSSPTITFIFHHALFDLKFILLALGLFQVPNFECTKTLAKAAHPHLKSGLKHLLLKILSIPIDKDIQHTWNEENLSDRQLEYACNDVIHLHQLFLQLKTSHLNLSIGNHEHLYQLGKEYIASAAELFVRGGENVVQFEDIDIKEIIKYRNWYRK